MSEKKRALITGVTGQDGSYLTELLLNKGYIVVGIVRRASTCNMERLENVISNANLKLCYGDLADSSNIKRILNDIMVQYQNLEMLEVYHLGAMSDVKVSFDIPEYVGNVDGLGTLRMLEAVFRRGVGAYHTNPQSVRPSVTSPDQWGLARVNGFLSAIRTGKFKRGRFDTDLIPEGHPLSSKD